VWEEEEVVAKLVDELVVGAELAIADKALLSSIVPFTVAKLLSKVRAAIEWEFIDNDIGEPELITAPSWSVGTEPSPALIDAWSRGAVPAKKPGPPISQLGKSADGSDPPRSPRAKTPLGSERGDRMPDALPLPDLKGPVVIAKLPPGTLLPKPEKVAPVVTAGEKLRRRLEAESREEHAKLSQLQADLKGRNYTYTAAGNVIVMEDVSADRLPAFQQQPRLGLSGQPPTSTPAPPRGGKSVKGKGGIVKKGGSLEFGGSSTFKQLDSLQPPLMESMNVGLGVTLKQGEVSKGGEARVFDGERMSKAVFEQLANSAGGFTRRSVGDQATSASGDPLGLGNATGADVQPTTPFGSPGKGSAAEGSQAPARRPLHMPPSPAPEGKFGARNALTRERGGMPTRDRLPPPALGATTGHGQGVPYCGQQQQPSSPGGIPRSLTASETLKVSNPGALQGL